MKGGRHRRAVRTLDIGYGTPEWQYAVDDLSPFIFWPLAAALYLFWAWFAVWNNALGLIPGERLILAIAGFALAYLLADGIDRAFAIMGGGYGLAPRGSRRLKAQFTRGRFRIRFGGAWHLFDAAVPHAFSMREHVLRYDEARAEERARAHGMGQRPDHYRRAWQIVLDYRHDRFVLASVHDEERARLIVRHLLDLDAFARGSDGSRTRTDEGGAAPTGRRPKLD